MNIKSTEIEPCSENNTENIISLHRHQAHGKKKFFFNIKINREYNLSLRTSSPQKLRAQLLKYTHTHKKKLTMIVKCTKKKTLKCEKNILTWKRERKERNEV